MLNFPDVATTEYCPFWTQLTFWSNGDIIICGWFCLFFIVLYIEKSLPWVEKIHRRSDTEIILIGEIASHTNFCGLLEFIYTNGLKTLFEVGRLRGWLNRRFSGEHRKKFGILVKASNANKFSAFIDFFVICNYGPRIQVVVSE